MALDLIIINGVTVQTLGYVEKNGLSTVDGRRNGKRYTFMVDGHEALLAIRNAGCNARFCYCLPTSWGKLGHPKELPALN